MSYPVKLKSGGDKLRRSTNVPLCPADRLTLGYQLPGPEVGAKGRYRNKSLHISK